MLILLVLSLFDLFLWLRGRLLVELLSARGRFKQQVCFGYFLYFWWSWDRFGWTYLTAEMRRPRCIYDYLEGGIEVTSRSGAFRFHNLFPSYLVFLSLCVGNILSLSDLHIVPAQCLWLHEICFFCPLICRWRNCRLILLNLRGWNHRLIFLWNYTLATGPVVTERDLCWQSNSLHFLDVLRRLGSWNKHALSAAEPTDIRCKVLSRLKLLVILVDGEWLS